MRRRRPRPGDRAPARRGLRGARSRGAETLPGGRARGRATGGADGLLTHLAAAALGLGAQWVSLDPPRQEALKHILGIPPEIKLFSLVPLGYPAHQPTGHRRELGELVHYEKYDMSKLRSQETIQEFVKYLRRKDIERVDLLSYTGDNKGK